MKILAGLLALLLLAPAAFGENCTEKTCVNVFTENGQLVIEAHKNGQKSETKKVTKVIPRPKPTVKRSYKPRSYTPPPAQKPKPKPKITKKSTPTLADRIIKALPSTGIAYQPEGDSLIGIPTYFWSDLPTRFQTVIPILGEKVGIDIKPIMTWNFGDGAIKVTSKNGGPFPNGEITHSYEKPGYYLVEMVALWKGYWTLGGVKRLIPGTIEQVAEIEIRAVSAETIFVGN